MSRTTVVVGGAFEADAPVLGARRVLWLIDGVWERKGWMMPTTKRNAYTKYPLLPQFHRAR